MRFRILNVDDSAASRYVRTHALGKAGYEVLEAASGAQALDCVKASLPDAILLDVRLPDIDGFEVARQLRSDPATAEIPVIFISAAERDAEVQAGALDDGADAYLVEPVFPGVIVSTVRASLRRSELERELKESNARLRQELDGRRAAEAQLGVALDAAEMGTWILDRESGLVTASETTHRLFGLEHRGEARALADYLAVLDASEVAGREALSGLRKEADFRVGERWLLWRGRSDAAGVRTIGALIDISERRAAGERARFQAHLLDAMGDAVIATDAAGIVTYWGAAAERIYGWSQEEALGKRIVDLTPAEMSREQASELMARLAAGESWSGDFAVRRKDGSVFWAHVTDTPLVDAAGTVVGVIGLSSDISAKKRLEEELRDSEERFRVLAEHSMDLVARLDATGTPEYLSPSYESLLGYSREEVLALLRQDPLALAHADDREALRGAMDKMAESGDCRLAYRVRRKDGEYLWIDATGKCVGARFHVAGRDITQRVSMEEELRQAVAEHKRYHAMLEALMEFIPEGITIAEGQDIRIQWVSRHGRELTGRTSEQVEGLPVGEHSAKWGLYWADGVTPASDDDLPLTRAARRGEIVNDEEWMIQRPDGNRVWILCNAGPIRDRDGQITGAVIAWRDVTERRAGAVALAQSEARLQLAMQSAGLGVWEYDPVSRRVYVSERLSEVWGVRRHEERVDRWFEGVHPDDRGRVISALEAAGRGEADYDVECRVLRGGETRWTRSTGRLLTLPDGRRSIVGILEDITARKRAEEVLRASEERLALSQSAGGIGTWDADLVSGKLLWSEGMFQLWGLEPSSEPLTLEQAYQYILEEDRAMVRSAVEAAIQGERPYAAEFRVVPPGGKVRWMAGKATVTFDERSQPVRMLGVNYDVTARKNAEEALRVSNQELQQFAYAISHDLQEPLRTITNFAELARRRLEPNVSGQAAEFLDIVLGAAKRMRQLIEDLLAYSRLHDQRGPAARVDLNQAFDWAVSNLQTTIEECGGEVSRGPLPAVPGDFTRLAQLLQNLIGNSLKYRRPDVAPAVRVSAADCGHEYVISIEDNGPGIPMEFAGQVFLPFKRLHGREVSGSGLGLAICKRIVDRHEGRIWLEPAPEGGARICFALPAGERWSHASQQD